MDMNPSLVWYTPLGGTPGRVTPPSRCDDINRTTCNPAAACIRLDSMCRPRGSCCLASRAAAIAENEKIDVTNEQVGQHIAFLAQREGITMDKMVDRIRKNNAFGMIRQQLLRQQVLDFLLKESKTE